MGKQSKKRKHSELSSTSGDKEKAKSPKAEKKKFVEDHKSAAEDAEPCVSSTAKDESKINRQIKSAVHRLAEKQETKAKHSHSCHTATPPCIATTSTAELNENSSKKNQVGSHKETARSSLVFHEPKKKKRHRRTKHKAEEKGQTHQRNEKKSFLKNFVSCKRRSKKLKRVTSVSGAAASERDKRTDPSRSKKLQLPDLSKLLSFKIPKVSRRETGRVEDRDVASSSTNLKHDKLSDSGIARSNSTQEIVEQAHSSLDVTHHHSFEGHFKSQSLSSEFQTKGDTNKEPCYGQIPVVEDPRLALPEDRLQLNLTESQITCMDIDAPEEVVPHLPNVQATHHKLILVLDTNILISHLAFVRRISLQGIQGLGFPLILIPWVVIKELEGLQHRKSDSAVSLQASFATSFLLNSLRENPHIAGQSMQQDSRINHPQEDVTNDDRVLQCCLQYQSLHPECALILCTDDRNLCCKALVSGVKALRKSELQAEVEGSRNGDRSRQSFQSPVLPQINPRASVPMQREICEQAQSHVQGNVSLSFEVVEEDKLLPSEADKATTGWDLRRCVSELETCLHEVLSVILEEGMKAAFNELWLEIVYLKPPWTLRDVLQCFKKHWIAVFGHEVPRPLLQNVLDLIQFFQSGGNMDHITTSKALEQAKELVRAFWKTSAPVSNAIAVMDHISNQLQSQLRPPVEEVSPPEDFIMNDEEEDDNVEEQQPTPAQNSYQDVKRLFKSLWINLVLRSRTVLTELGFDPETMQRERLVGDGPQLQDSLACLDKLSSSVSQLLEALCSIVSFTADLNQASIVLSIFHQLFGEESEVTAKDVLDCFSVENCRTEICSELVNLRSLLETLRDCSQTSATSSFTSDPTMA